VAAECAERIFSLATFVPLREIKENERAKTALASLSFSELTIVLAVFSELVAGEGLIVAAKIAEKVDIPKTTAANALRKLEGAGMVETRSLGVKGTYIKVINDNFMEELRKFD